jgi:hypothetical protein
MSDREFSLNEVIVQLVLIDRNNDVVIK